MTVLVLGIPSEPPVAAVVDAIRRCRGEVVVWNQRTVLDTRAELRLAPSTGGEPTTIEGWLAAPGIELDLADLSGIYVRLTDNDEIPDLAGLGEDHPARRHADHVVDTLFALCQLSPAVVVNRPGAPDENGSKPRHLELLASFFETPATLVTDDPDAVRDFWAGHGRIIYKSISGERSIVTELLAEDDQRLEALRRCPAQFQALVEGLDVRVHALTSGETFATAACADTIDYRYGAESSMHPFDLPDEVAAACVEVTGHLGLEVAGVDLKLTADGRWVCFEVNPSPAFIAFESATGQPIAAAIARLLTGGDCGCGC